MSIIRLKQNVLFRAVIPQQMVSHVNSLLCRVLIPLYTQQAKIWELFDPCKANGYFYTRLQNRQMITWLQNC